MPIAFTCPKCQKAYKVKDDLAGKRVVCSACKAPMRVPAPMASAAVPSAEAESLAIEALTDEAPQELAAPEVIEFECPQCMEMVTVDAKFGGKQSPCPSCRRIVRVPAAKNAKPKNWRETADRPSLAKTEVDPALDGAWGNVAGTSVVSRDSLEEAEAIPARRPKTPVRTKVIRGVIGASFLALVAVGALLFFNRRAEVVRDDYVKKGLDLLSATGDATLPPLATAAAHRGAAEYFLRLREPKPLEAQRHLEIARTRIIQTPPGADGGVERLLLLSEVVLTQADLCGTPEQAKAEQRLPWDKVMTDLRKSLDPLKSIDPSLHDGVVLLEERLIRRLGTRGDPEQPMILTLPMFMYAPHNEADGHAVLGLGLLNFKDEEKAKVQAAQARPKLLAAGPAGQRLAPARLAALFLALNQTQALPEVRPPAGSGEPTLVSRLAYAEGLARQGNLDEARNLTEAPGPFDHRFQAKVVVATVTAEKDPNSPDIGAAVGFLERELGTRDLPDWPLIRLGQLCARSSSPAGKQLLEFLPKLGNLSAKGQAVRAWVVMEIMRSPTTGVTLNDEAVKTIAPPTALGSILAWEALARRNAAFKLVTNPTPVIESWPVPARPAAFVGTALGLQDP